MIQKKISKTWHPDPKISILIKPRFDQRYSALAASKIPILDENKKLVRNPNIKTYFKYWNYYKDELNAQQLAEWIPHMQKKQKQLENLYVKAYDELIISAYHMMQIIKQYDDSWEYGKKRSYDKKPDINAMKITCCINKLQFDILTAKYKTENEIILFKLKRKKLLRRLYLTSKKTHVALLRLLRFLHRREKVNVALDCQTEPKAKNLILIQCGICASRTLNYKKIIFNSITNHHLIL